VQRVSIVDDHERVMEVVVEDKQLSLAIGKKGQNVRLAAKLTGWRIDIKSEEEKRREVEAQFGELEVPAGESTDLSTDLSAEADAVESAQAEADAVASAKAEADAVASAKVEADTVAPAKAEADTVAPAKVEAGEGATGPANVEGSASAAKAEGDETAEASDMPLPYTLAGIGEKTVRKLVDGGFATLEALAAANTEQLSAIPGIGEKTAEKILAAARGDAPDETINDV
jgi:N utilization substance protein A